MLTIKDGGDIILMLFSRVKPGLGNFTQDSLHSTVLSQNLVVSVENGGFYEGKDFNR